MKKNTAPTEAEMLPAEAAEKASDPGDREHFRRVNLTIREDQYRLISERGLALSALVRDLLDDRFASNKIVFNLSDEGKKLYDVLVGSIGVHDIDIEPFFLAALDEFLGQKLEHLSQLRAAFREKAKKLA